MIDPDPVAATAAQVDWLWEQRAELTRLDADCRYPTARSTRATFGPHVGPKCTRGIRRAGAIASPPPYAVPYVLHEEDERLPER